MLIIGHRGARGLAPENTLESIKIALQNKVDGIELDVRVTADKVPILAHDEEVGRLKINRATYKALKTTMPSLATLDQALRQIANKCQIIVEIKPGENIGPIVDTINDRFMNGLKKDKLLIASFDYKLLANIKSLLPDTPLIVNEKWSSIRALKRANKLGTKCITMNKKWLNQKIIKSLTAKGFTVSAYTLNDAKMASKWKHAGLHAAVTDFPDRFI